MSRARTHPLFERLIAADEIAACAYDGFWAPMDTLKDRERLESLVESGGSVWQVWDAPEPVAAGGRGRPC